MKYVKYQHVSRLNNQEVAGLLDGVCHIFPKIDGTNATIFLGDDGEVHFGSRNRELELGNDNAGFMAQYKDDMRFKEYFEKHPTHRLYGEFLVPHTIKAYEDNAWREFYVFDVCKDTGKFNAEGQPILEYLPYEDYSWRLDVYGIKYIPLLVQISNPTFDQLVELLDKNKYLIKEDSEAIGEGLVIKRYGYRNKYGRTVWGKIIAEEFHEAAKRKGKANKEPVKCDIEKAIIDEFLTTAYIEKEKAKYLINIGAEEWDNKYMGKFLGELFVTFLAEESFNFIKKFKYPIINTKALQSCFFEKVRKVVLN